MVKILSDLGVADRARLHVFNKIDRLSPEDRAEISRVAANGNGAMSRTAFVSAQTGEGLENLLALIDTALPIDPVTRVRLRLPLSEGRTLAMIHACGKVLNSEATEERISLEAEVPETLARRLTDFIV